MILSELVSTSVMCNGGSNDNGNHLHQQLPSKNDLPKAFGLHHGAGQPDSLLGMVPSIMGMKSSQRMLPPLNISNLFPASVPSRPEDIASNVLHELAGNSLFEPVTDDVFDFEPVPLPSRVFSNQNHASNHGTGISSNEAKRLSLLEDTLNKVLQMETSPFSDSSQSQSQHQSQCQSQPSDFPQSTPTKRTAASTFPESLNAGYSKRPRTEAPEGLVPAVVASSNNFCSPSQKSNRFRTYQEEQWNEKFEELLVFKSQRGHCCVPHTFEENPTLARWVKRQRYQYKLKNEQKASTMTDQRVEALEKVGFVWDSHGAAWMERWNELAEFQRAFGHANVPSNHPPNPQLATWVKCQRRQYKLFWDGKPSNMNLDRISRLERVGFEWELRSSHKKHASAPKPNQVWM